MVYKDALGFHHSSTPVSFSKSGEKNKQEEKTEKNAWHHLFPLSHQPQSKDQHWIGIYCTLGAILLHTLIKGTVQSEKSLCSR